MLDETRVRKLLEEILDSERTPEEICAGAPDLLPEVRARWERLRRVQAQMDVLFPSADATHLGGETPVPDVELPQVDGYDVQAVLGRGGMGVVYKARQLSLNRPVALKMLLAGAHAGSQEVGRFRREAEAVAALRHPNIVQLYDVGELAGRPYFTMELVEGGSLAEHLARAALSVRQAAEVAAVLAVAVQFAHQGGIVHRDLKPANVLCTADGMLKITDFGLARSIQRGPEFTVSGARVGTPSYMAPEQALGKASAIGPAVDIYALGAILYEMLTGRPPFQGDSAAETERQVIAEEPVPPSRRNARVPRDLETVCLKCLHKSPARRYASAQDLADDLYRFLDGKPVQARPVGLAERALKWARRRPTLATLSAALFVSLAAAVGTGVWLHRQESTRRTEQEGRRAHARQAVETDIAKAYAAGKAERWQEATVILAGARSHLANADSAELRGRVARADADLWFAQELDRIRQAAVVAVAEVEVSPPIVTDFGALAAGYRKAFARAGLDVDADPAVAAAHIRASALGETTLSALDLWALAAFMRKRAPEQEKLLRIARLADPDPAWGDRLRDPSAWRDRDKLRALADDALRTQKPPSAHQLGITSTLLAHLGAGPEGTRLLRAALLRRPQDFWLNREMGLAHGREAKFKVAVQYLRVVTALRPNSPWTINQLGCALLFTGEVEEAIAHLRRGIELAPKHESLQRNLAIALVKDKRTAEALAISRRLVEAEPKSADAACTLGIALALGGDHKKAIPMFQRSIRLNPYAVRAHYNLGVALAHTGRFEQAVAAFRKTVELDPKEVFAHYGLGAALQALGRHEEAIRELEWVIRQLEPTRTPTEVGLGGGLYSRYVGAQIRRTTSLCCLGHFARARDAAQSALTLPGLTQGARDDLQRSLDLCRQLMPLEPRLPALLAAKEIPEDPAAVRALAEWCRTYRRLPVAAVRLYERVFAGQPSLADKLAAGHRFSAARAAALAGCGLGEDAAKLDAGAKAALRKKALEWLRADLDAWAKRSKNSGAGEPLVAARAVRQWQLSKDLAGVRDTAALARLSEQERKDWQGLWAEVKGLVSRDPRLALEMARAHVARKQWAEALEDYSRLVKAGEKTDGEVWFEYAAVQLLSGDRRGYRQTCQLMLDAARNNKLRAYLMARACTLAPDSVGDLAPVARASAAELRSSPSAFWSLTEQGALCYRKGRAQDAVALFGKSLAAETRSGAAVLNWLWLALAHEKLGATDKARSYLDRAGGWLDSLGGELPANADALGLHRHNWLEAHVLRQEARRLLSPPSGK
jgi:eukaryotic-like serine/threonine-protein kinase